MADDALPDFFEGPKANGPAPERKKRKGKRGKRQKPEAAVAAVEAPKKRGRKPRSDTGPRGTKIDLSLAFTALSGLKPEDAKLVSRLASHLGTMPKRSRTRIVQALSHIFA